MGSLAHSIDLPPSFEEGFSDFVLFPDPEMKYNKSVI
jgi:hypothetical protein